MSEHEIPSAADGHFRIQNGGGVPGCALLYVSDGWDVANEFFTAPQLRGIAARCIDMAQELEETDAT